MVVRVPGDADGGGVCGRRTSDRGNKHRDNNNTSDAWNDLQASNRENAGNSALKRIHRKIINFMLFLLYLLPDRLQVTLSQKGPVVPGIRARHGYPTVFLGQPAASSIVAA